MKTGKELMQAGRVIADIRTARRADIRAAKRRLAIALDGALRTAATFDGDVRVPANGFERVLGLHAVEVFHAKAVDIDFGPGVTLRVTVEAVFEDEDMRGEAQ